MKTTYINREGGGRLGVFQGASFLTLDIPIQGGTLFVHLSINDALTLSDVLRYAAEAIEPKETA